MHDTPSGKEVGVYKSKVYLMEHDTAIMIITNYTIEQLSQGIRFQNKGSNKSISMIWNKIDPKENPIFLSQELARPRVNPYI